MQRMAPTVMMLPTRIPRNTVKLDWVSSSNALQHDFSGGGVGAGAQLLVSH